MLGEGGPAGVNPPQPPFTKGGNKRDFVAGAGRGREGILHNQLVLKFGGQGGGFLGHRQQRLVGHQGYCPRVVQNIGALVPLVGRIDGDADGAQQGQAEPAVQVLHAVGHEQTDPVTLMYSHGLEHSGGTQNIVLELAVGELPSGHLQE